MQKMKANFSELKKGEDICDFCRRLIQEGCHPDQYLELYRNRETPDVIVPKIGEAAKLRVKETVNEGPKFVKYVPFTDIR